MVTTAVGGGACPQGSKWPPVGTIGAHAAAIKKWLNLYVEAQGPSVTRGVCNVSSRETQQVAQEMRVRSSSYNFKRGQIW